MLCWNSFGLQVEGELGENEVFVNEEHPVRPAASASSGRNVTAIPMIDMDGNIRCVLIVVPGGKMCKLKLRLNNLGQMEAASERIFYASNESGCMTEDLFLDFLQLPEFGVYSRHNWGILVLDCARQHVTQRVEQLLFEKCIIVVWIPKSSTTLLQMLDNGANAAISRSLEKFAQDVFERKETGDVFRLEVSSFALFCCSVLSMVIGSW